MSMSTFQKVTLVSCLFLCVALLLPKMLLSRGRKDGQTEGSGHFPPMARQMSLDSQSQKAAGSQFSRAHNPEAIARAKGGTGVGTGGKSNLAGQIIPIYGFGILLYILYILFKITSKGKNAQPVENRFPSVRAENLKRKITDFELTQLQEKLRETEMAMEKIVSKASHSPERVRGVSADQEERLLHQLREITRVMQEGRLVEGVAPEKGAQDWEGFPEEPHCWEEEPFCGYDHDQQTSPEEQAERTDVGGADHQQGGAGDDEGGADEGDHCNNEEEGKADEEGGVECDVGMTEEGDEFHEGGKGEGNGQLGVAKEEMGGMGEELELTVKVSTTPAEEEKYSLNLPGETSTGCALVRRKNKKDIA